MGCWFLWLWVSAGAGAGVGSGKWMEPFLKCRGDSLLCCMVSYLHVMGGDSVLQVTKINVLVLSFVSLVLFFWMFSLICIVTRLILVLIWNW